MKGIKLCLAIALMVSGIQLFAQDNLDSYFDDGGIAQKSKIIKVGYDPYNGEFPITFEQEIARNLSVDYGIGFISIGRQNERYANDPIKELPNSGVGIFATANLRLYFKEYFERWYIGFQPKFNLMGGKLYTDFIFFNGGYQFLLAKTFTLDINAGMGVRTYRYVEQVTSVISYADRGSHFYIPISFKLGYAF